MESMTFLKILMLRRDMSTKELAEGLGISTVKAKEWIDGERAIPIQRMDSLRKLLKIDNADLLSEKMKLPTEEELGLINSKFNIKKVETYKSKKIILQPVGTTLINFNKSILNAKGESPTFGKKFVTRFLKESEYNDQSADIDLSIWGVKDGKNLITLNRFHRISSGDLVVFYFAQKLIAYGEVIHKTEDEEFAESVWGDSEYKNLILLNSVKSIDVEFKKVAKELYGKASNSLQSMRILDEEKSKKISKYLDIK
ncbi:hypothetical protein ADM98_08520 [Exiguobacterium sp. BMC-KP]|uniref:helix-turn-helix domain-containing protein n=1 Tax=Exiguobacterium sp. BMC-KP TaxID=1684312 RepID=UPI0006AA468A|nr:helix-turn-helix transcriptional regulator [Exiguobacterium sp. BMC-KP]KOP28957.1 hypothetical protein ADM98_08520 [Exiguobacterium sp. BMC-KP]